MEKVFNIRVFKALINLSIVVAIFSFVLTLFFSYFVYKLLPTDNELKQENLTIKSSSTSTFQFPLKTTRFSIPADVKFSEDHKTFIPKEVSGKFGIYLNQGDSKNLMVALTMLYILVIFAVIIGMLLYFKKIIENVEKGKIFTIENIRRLKTLGIISLIYPVYKFLESKVLLHLIFSRLKLPTGFTPDTSSQKEITVACAIMTFVFFIMASIFQYGKKLKEEQELTI